MSRDLDAYIKAGFMPQFGGQLDTTYGYVGRQLAARYGRMWNEMEDDDKFIRFNQTTYNFEINIGDTDIEMWAPTEYYWDNGLCLTKIKEV